MLSEPAQEKVYVYEASKTTPLKQSRLLGWGKEVGLVLALLGVALGLRLYGLTRNSLWLDESSDLLRAYNLNFLDTLTVHEPYLNHPPLYFPIMHLWAKSFGLGEIAVRMFSVVMALATLPLIYLLVKHWLNRNVALIATLLLGVAPLHLFWSQSVRPYSWYTLMVVISMALIWLISEKPLQNWRWVAYGFSAVLLLYAQYSSFHVIFAQVLFLAIVLNRNTAALLRLGITLVLLGLSFVPWLGNFMEQAQAGPAFYLNFTGPSQITETIEAFASWDIPNSYVYLTGGVFLPLFVLGLIWLWKNQARLGWFLLNWCLLPVITSWLSSLLRPNFLVRYMVFCLPAFLIIVAVGIWSLYSRGRLLAYAALVLVVGLNMISYLNYSKNYNYQNWRGIVNYIVENRQEGDVIFLATPEGYTREPFDYYYRYQLGSPGNMPRNVLPTQVTPEMVAKLFNGPKRVWMLASYDNNDNIVWATETVKSKIPSEFKPVYNKEYPASEQGTLALTLWVKNG